MVQRNANEGNEMKRVKQIIFFLVFASLQCNVMYVCVSVSVCVCVFVHWCGVSLLILFSQLYWGMAMTALEKKSTSTTNNNNNNSATHTNYKFYSIYFTELYSLIGFMFKQQFYQVSFGPSQSNFGKISVMYGLTPSYFCTMFNWKQKLPTRICKWWIVARNAKNRIKNGWAECGTSKSFPLCVRGL